MTPEKIAIPPKIGTLPLCEARSPARSINLKRSAKNITLGIATKVIRNAEIQEKIIFNSGVNIILILYVKITIIIE